MGSSALRWRGWRKGAIGSSLRRQGAGPWPPEARLRESFFSRVGITRCPCNPARLTESPRETGLFETATSMLDGKVKRVTTVADTMGDCIR
jgi:hypothetical protein